MIALLLSLQHLDIELREPSRICRALPLLVIWVTFI
jgi:hypothetical protein